MLQKIIKRFKTTIQSTDWHVWSGSTLCSSPFYPLLTHLRLLLHRWLNGQSGDDAVHAGQEEELHNERHKVPAQDETTADHIGGQGHDLSHSQWGQDVSHLIDPPHGCIHTFCWGPKTQRLIWLHWTRWQPIPGLQSNPVLLSATLQTCSLYTIKRSQFKLEALSWSHLWLFRRVKSVYNLFV